MNKNAIYAMGFFATIATSIGQAETLGKTSEPIKLAINE